MIDYKIELKRLTNCLTKELKIATPSAFRVVSYLIQTLLCAGAVVAIAIWGLLNKMADEMEKGQKEQKEKQPPPTKKKADNGWDIPVEISEKCPFGITKYCVPNCHYWVKRFDGGGYCNKFTEKKGSGW